MEHECLGTAEIEFESVPADLPMCMIEQSKANNQQTTVKGNQSKGKEQFTEEEKAKMLKEVEQQADFGIQK